jgi:oxygen-independent coproporphyrinogen-3 oxidase
VKPTALYIHIPFCQHLCHYCDFAKVFYTPEWASAYLYSLEEELSSLHLGLMQTIYLGGGTPSALSLAELERLLAFVSPHLDQGGEFTCEVNPENFTREKAVLLRRYGVNRLSIGVQSSHDSLLKLMGRAHTFAEAKAAVSLSREVGFSNLSCDLIYGLPGESLATLQEDITALLSLKSDHLSSYCLSVNPGTQFFDRKIPEMDQALAADEYDLILASFRKAGYDRYEVSNFAKEGKKSRHNLVYWKDEPYYGLGLGAAGYVDDIRYSNTRNLQRYLKKQWRDEEEKVSSEDDRKYFFLTNLRLEEGFALADYEKRFHERFDLRYANQVKKLVDTGLLVLTDERVYPSDRGILLLDRILLALY